MVLLQLVKILKIQIIVFITWGMTISIHLILLWDVKILFKHSYSRFWMFLKRCINVTKWKMSFKLLVPVWRYGLLNNDNKWNFVFVIKKSFLMLKVFPPSSNDILPVLNLIINLLMQYKYWNRWSIVYCMTTIHSLRTLGH